MHEQILAGVVQNALVLLTFLLILAFLGAWLIRDEPTLLDLCKILAGVLVGQGTGVSWRSSPPVEQ